MISNKYGFTFERILFEDVNLRFNPGNCYGVIGANGSGKSTFLKILAGEIDTSHGDIVIDKNQRVAMLRQDYALMRKELSILL